MSSLCNRMMYDEGLGLLGPNKHGIRTRRRSVLKQQVHRREDLTATELFDAKVHQIRCSDSLWKLSSASSSPMSSLACSQSRPRFMKEITASSSSSSKHRRFDTSIMEPFQDSIVNSNNAMIVRSAGGLSGLSSSADSGFGSLSPSLSSCPQPPKWPAPLPPVLSRLNMPGSPLTNPGDNSHDFEYTFPQRPARSTKHLYAAGSGGSGGGAGGARTMGMGMSGRGTSGGNGGVSSSGNMDGDSSVASGMHPGEEGAGGSDDGDAEGGENEGGRLTQAPVPMPTPSPYTFRRRNAIVEGSEDAPKANDFPDLS
ncbi:hypothetical protein EDD21DRAFT_412982 [Dissophora ornata]|nr:hypothetical protein BGZ58_007894 [Dissophora ornata]KAI8603516.1 hypothetical protein EDD21DRAFT_412982 [Dissophora ornata]